MLSNWLCTNEKTLIIQYFIRVCSRNNTAHNLILSRRHRIADSWRKEHFPENKFTTRNHVAVCFTFLRTRHHHWYTTLTCTDQVRTDIVYCAAVLSRVSRKLEDRTSTSLLFLRFNPCFWIKSSGSCAQYSKHVVRLVDFSGDFSGRARVTRVSGKSERHKSFLETRHTVV